jgi:SAM-dependent methyltransferase
MNLPTLGRFVMPDVVGTHFLLHEGAKVADFGAGSGFFLTLLSKTVGQTGRVFACEIQRPLVEKLGNFARSNGLQNVDPLWCDLEAAGGIKIANDSLDAGILVNTLFQLEDKVTAITEIHRTLRSEGVLHVIDWSESFSGLGPTSDSVVNKDEATALLESHGFVLEREYPAGEHHYGLAFRKI